MRATLSASFRAAMEAAGPFEDRPVLAVAVSGGSDSLALATLAQQWAEARGGFIIALTVDHGLRAASGAEAETVHSWLEAAAIPHHILAWGGDKPASNIQAEAREARYGLLAGWCRAEGILHLLVAHHKDDQAETFLLRLQRGSGVDGLASMPLTSSVQGVRIVRPLLGFSKASLQALLQAKHQAWIEDPSNSNPHYARSHIRQFLHKPFANDQAEALIAPDIFTARLVECARHMGRARATLEEETARAMLQVVDIYPEAYARIKREKLAECSEEVGLRIIAALLTTLSGQIYRPRFSELMRLYKNSINTGPFTAVTLWGCYLKEAAGYVYCFREPAAIAGPLQLKPGETLRWDNRFQVRANTALTVHALGEEGWQVIKKHCQAVSLPKSAIITLPAFKSLESVIAVPHIYFYSSQIEEMRATDGIQVSACFAPLSPLAGEAFYYNP